MTPRKTKSLRALFNAAETRVPLLPEVARGLNELERIAFPERFRKVRGRLIRKR